MFANNTELAALDVPMLDDDGHEVVTVIVKATYVIGADGRTSPHDEPCDIRANDLPYDPENLRSSLRYPSDLCTRKVGTDVVVVGDAVSPRPTKSIDVAIRVRAVTRTIRVHGPRCFQRNAFGVGIGQAIAFERKPLVYEAAYGGCTDDFDIIEERNWSGVGVAKRATDLVDRAAPQIEHPELPHKSASDSHAPIGTGAIPSHWLPRKAHAGTYDARWQTMRMPFPPEDFDPRFHNVAHPDLLFEEPLRSGDVVAVSGMTMDGSLVFELPGFPVTVFARHAISGRSEQALGIDTVLLEPERRRLELVGRATFRVGRRDALRELSAELV